MKNKNFKKWKNLTWLCRPYWKYGKVYVILSLIFFVGMSPLHEIVYVYSPEIIVRLLNEGSPFSHLVVVALIIAGATFLKDVLRLFFEPYFTKKQTEINVKVKRNIYVKAMEIDYKYVDSPEYYNEYAWAMNEYVCTADKPRVRFFKAVSFGSVQRCNSLFNCYGDRSVAYCDRDSPIDSAKTFACKKKQT